MSAAPSEANTIEKEINTEENPRMNSTTPTTSLAVGLVVVEEPLNPPT
jgi:hypothetical protein